MPERIAAAIAANDPAKLAAALARAPEGWEQALNHGHTCWARVLTDPRRTHLLSVLRGAGMCLPPVVRQGRYRGSALGLALRHGRLDLLEPLLEMGADATAPVDGQSLLAHAIERLSRPAFHRAEWEVWGWAAPPGCLPGKLARGRSSRAGDLVHLAPVTQRLLAAGARPCARALASWLALARSRPNEPWLEWAGKAGQAGARPAWSTPSVGVKLCQLAFLARPNPITKGWLTRALEGCPPWPTWPSELTATDLSRAPSQPSPALPVEDLIDHMLAIWPPLAPEAWGKQGVEDWQRTWGSDRLPGQPGPVRVAFLRWALANGFPFQALVWGKRALVHGLPDPAAPHALPAPSMHALLELIVHALPDGLATRAIAQPDAPPTTALEEFTGLRWWPRVASQVLALDARRRGSKLEQALPPARDPTGPRSRV